jgi:uncharacterized protein YlxW (UPF0749 family)
MSEEHDERSGAEPEGRAAEPAAPAEPTEPIASATPEGPAEPARSRTADSGQPVGPGQAADSVQPGDREQPADPGQPPVTGEAGKPTGPGTPGEPAPPSDPAGSPDPAAPAAGPPVPPPSGRQRLVAGLWPPRLSRPQLIVAVLLFALGLGLAIQVRSTGDDSALRGARQEDLVRILTELDNRGQRLEDEKRGLESQRTQLETSSNQAAEALRQTREKARQLGVLAGTVAAQGPGIILTITDPHGGVAADSLLDTLQELRAAGAEAIQINDVRAVAGTYFTQGTDGVLIDGHPVTQPYRFKVIGDPQDLEPALNIPGGVVQTLEKEQATADVVRSQKIVVDALRPPEQPDYARSSQ